MTNEWDEYAEGWDEDPGARAYSVAAFDSLLAVVGGTEQLRGARVLDFGCGTGLLTERLVDAGATVVAVDTSTAMIEVLDAKRAAHGWTTVTTSTHLPDTSDRFDLVVCSSVLAFVDDYAATARDLVARLAPGGRLVQWDWERTDDDDHGLSRTEIADALGAAGLVDVTVDTAFRLPFEDQFMAPLIGHGAMR